VAAGSRGALTAAATERARRALPAVIGLVLFIAALEIIRTELRTVTWSTLIADVTAVPPGRLVFATLLTILNYAALTGYDFLALEYVGRRLQPRRVALASFLSYAIANNVGFAMFSGASMRYRFYTRWGLTAEELARLVLAYSVTFWLGLLLVGGVGLLRGGVPADVGIPRGVVQTLGTAMIALSVGYVAASAVVRSPLRAGRFVLPLPDVRISAAQLVVSVIDWALAGGVLYVLLPPSSLTFAGFVGAFVTAQLLALVSHVPGGLGVFEGLLILLLHPSLDSAALVPSLIVYRVVYYLLPLSAALLVLVADEVRQRREQAARVGALFGRLTELITSRLLSVFTFFAGVVLLFSGATPAAAGRLALLHRVLPLGIIEASHFLSSVLGAALLILSQGLARRLDAAYFLTVTAMLAGMATSLLKGADFEEAALLGAVLLVLWRARPAFDRRAALVDTRFSPAWIVAIVAAMGASVWLMSFAFKHVQYRNELWWQFELRGEASRGLRAAVGAAVTLLLFAISRLIRHAPHEASPPTDVELADAARVITTQSATLPFLVFLRDKAVLFDDDRAGFVMYGVEGRTWVALGDPVCPPSSIAPLIRTFLERCDDFGGVAVFYQVRKETLHAYADFGLTFVKLGEEAMVDLSTFSMEGGHASKHRQALRRLDKEHARFRVIPQPETAAAIDALRAVSDDWLARKAGGEKGFSLGSFKPDYIERFPVAVIERDGEILAFANLWTGADRVELSLDLMRYRHDAPVSIMESLFVAIIVWGKDQGYRWFSLGMAPLSGFESSPVAPLWNRLAAFLYQHGEAVYNFQGLRAYKEKFNPVWEPRYLAYPGGMRLPRILADVAALVAGGYRKIFLK
jgi:phosphatidylglycerol lysyltransferase